jgi:hypothetical protein
MYSFYGLMNNLPAIGAGIVAFVVICVIVIRVNRAGPVLVLKEFRLNENEDEFLKIVGRPSGILSWILSLCGIDPVTSLECNRKAIKFEESAIRQGKNTVNIPLVAVTGVFSGVNKPFGLLVFGILFILGGIVAAIALPRYAGSVKTGSFFIGLVIGVIFLILYSLKKTMFFSIYNGGDKPIKTICMKKSIIEGQSIDEVKFGAAAQEINKAVLDIHYILANVKNPSDPPKRSPQTTTTYVVKRKMKLYKNPGDYSNVVCILNPDENVTYLKTGSMVSQGNISAPMFHIKTIDGDQGWCFSGFLELKE